MEGFRFATEVSVRFAETDAQGVAHHAVYLVWLEVARIDYLARFSGGYPALREQGIEALTTEARVRYLDAARFNDRLRVHARCVDVRGARFRSEYAIARDDLTVAEASTSHACVDGSTLRPRRVPEWLVEAIATAEAPA